MQHGVKVLPSPEVNHPRILQQVFKHFLVLIRASNNNADDSIVPGQFILETIKFFTVIGILGPSSLNGVLKFLFRHRLRHEQS